MKRFVVLFLLSLPLAAETNDAFLQTLRANVSEESFVAFSKLLLAFQIPGCHVDLLRGVGTSSNCSFQYDIQANTGSLGISISLAVTNVQFTKEQIDAIRNIAALPKEMKRMVEYADSLMKDTK